MSADNYNWNGEDPSQTQDLQTGEEQQDMGYHRPGAAITAMVLGICSVSLCWYPIITSIPCLIMGIVAVVMAKKEQNRTEPRYFGFLKAARITGVIGIVLSILCTVVIGLLMLYAVSNSGGSYNIRIRY